MTEWKIYRIHQLQQPNGLVGGPFGSSLGTRDYTAAGVPVIRGSNLSSDKRFDDSEFVFVSEKKAHELSRNIAIPGDVIFTQRGTLGQVGLIPASPYNKYIISQSQMRLRVNPELATAEYIYYIFRTSDMVEMIENHAIVSGVPHVNLGILADLEITIPPVEEQHQIATLLSALDSKINQNREMNHTLEAMASALFQKWCEDCDSQSVSRAVRELVGEGTMSIGDGYRAKNSELNFADGLPFARAGNLQADGIDLVGAELLLPSSAAAAGDKKSRPLDAIFTSKGTVGRITQVLPSTPPFVFSPQICYWRSHKPERLHPQVLYRWMKSREFREQVDEVKGQTDMADYVNLRDQHAMEMTLPWTADQHKLGDRLSILTAKVDTNNQQNRILRQMRDTLLPKLISGEIRLKDAEKIVGEAT